MTSISTIRTINAHLNSLNNENTSTYDNENRGPSLGQAQQCAG